MEYNLNIAFLFTTLRRPDPWQFWAFTEGLALSQVYTYDFPSKNKLIVEGKSVFEYFECHFKIPIVCLCSIANELFEGESQDESY